MAVNRITQVLHDEHCAAIALMERLGQLIARHRESAPPDTADGAIAKLLSDLPVGLSGEVERHFAFEENELFPYLEAAGDAAIGVHLSDEHRAIRPLAARVSSLAREARVQGFDAGRWEEFSRTARELCDRLVTHAQKEEMALLPLIDESMDAETEDRLFLEYVQGNEVS
jgi:iron-sulfur cluster repair protein YtfE (RIC family)